MKVHHFPVRHSQVEIFIKGPELFDRMLKDIEKARHHIHMLFYIFRNDSFGKKVIQLLEKKAAEGVEIRILLDWLGSFLFPRKVMKELKQKGIHIQFCHTPRLPFYFYKLQCRNHRKITVIDGKIGFLGGVNVGKEYIDQHEKLHPWRDCHVRFTGEGVNDLQLQFLTDWAEAKREKMLDGAHYFPHLEKGPIVHQFQSFEGVGLEEEICKLIQEAKREVTIGTPYFIPGKKAFQSVKHALRRGVHITIILPNMSDHFLIKEASYRYLRKLCPLGASIYHYHEGFYHAKVFIVDEKLCSIGTVNMDKRSFYFNHEMSCFFYDHEMVKKMIHMVKRDLSKSTKLNIEMLDGRGSALWVKEWLAFLVSPFL